MGCCTCCCFDKVAHPTKRCCVCFPYNDTWLITSQIVSIVAFLLSFTWWLQWLVGFFMLIMMQVLWCCRMKHCGLLTIGILQSICAVLSFFAAIYILIAWPNDRWCNVWLLNIDEENNEDWHSSQYKESFQPECNYLAYATIEFIAAILWSIAAYGPLQFIYSGKLHQYQMKAMSQHQEDEPTSSRTVAIEMGGIIHPQHRQQQLQGSGGAEPVLATAVLPSSYDESIEMSKDCA